MANATGKNAAAGDLAKTTGIEVISGKSDGTGCSKGDVVHLSTAGLAIKATTSGTQADGFGVALEAVAANADGRFAVGNTWVYVIADVAIIPFNGVLAAASAGQVGPVTEPAASALNSIFNETEVQIEIDLVKTYFGKWIGRYIGHQL